MPDFVDPVKELSADFNRTLVLNSGIAVTAPWGVHPEPIPNELQVHNLEDGGVMVRYNCPEACADLVAQLRQIVEPYDEGVVLAPYPNMNGRIALTAWTRIDTFDTFDKTRIERFIKAYRGIDHHVAGQG